MATSLAAIDSVSWEKTKMLLAIKKVKTTDYIGYMGETGLAYGPHLHLEIAPCRLFTQSDKNCGSWSKYTKYVSKIYSNGTFKGPRDLIYFPKKGVTFKGR